MKDHPDVHLGFRSTGEYFVVTDMRAHVKNAARLFRLVVLLAPLAWSNALVARAWSQEDDPFGAPVEGAEAPPADAAPADAAPAEDMPADDAAPAGDEPTDTPAFGDSIDVFGADAAPAAPKPAAPGAKAAADAAQVGPTDPAALAILDWKPQTPAQILRAIDILAELGHAAHAKPFLDQLASSNLDAAAKAELVDSINPARLLKLARHPDLAATLGPMIDDWLAAAEAHRRDAQRLAATAQQLTDPSPRVREQAVIDLLKARESAVAPLVAILADPNRTAQHAGAKQVLSYLGDQAVNPLLGVLESPNEALKIQAVEVLGQISALPAVPQLLGPLVSPASSTPLRTAASQALSRILGRVPDAQEAIGMLEKEARTPLEASRNDDPLTAAPAVVWHWNRHTNESMPVVYDQTGAALAKATRLARDLYLLDPARGDWRRLYLTAMLQAAQVRRGLGVPLSTGPHSAYTVAAYYGPDVIDDLLAHALHDGYIPAAIAATQILGDIGHSQLLVRGGVELSPLADTANHPDQRLRFAGTQAIMKLAPTEPYPGSSHVADGLGFFARSYGTPRVLVAHPNSAEAQTMAGLAATLGYETDIATNGRDAFELAVRSPDYDFVLLHQAIDSPGIDHLVAQFRRDPRTARLPIGLVAIGDDLERLERFAARTPHAMAFVQPADEAQMKIRAAQLLDHAGRWHLSAAERKAQAVSALDWLAVEAARPELVYDVYRQEPALATTLYIPELSARAAAVLAELGTATSQQALLEMADLAAQPLALREAAASSLARSIAQFGLRLSRDEILHQYDLYNSNAGRNGDTHTVLGTVLDAIEQNNTQTGGQ
jgi:HEAT repeat protein